MTRRFQPVMVLPALGVCGFMASSAFAAAEGAPKFELLSVDGLAALWSIVVFLIVALILRATTWKPIVKTLADREKFIEESLASARRDREEAQAQLARYAEQIRKARDEATAIVEEGRRDAEVVKRSIEEKARTEAQAMTERARREIGIARDTAVKELYTLTARLATEAASRIIRKELNPQDHERLIAESIEQVGRLSRN